MRVQDPNWVYGKLVDGARDAIVVSDTNGVLRLWNTGAEYIFGYTAEEALGQPLDLIIPDRFRDRHWDGYARVMDTAYTKYKAELLAVPALTKYGKRISIEFTITLLQDDSGVLHGIGAIIRDVTDHRNEDNTIREQLSELKKRLVD